MAKKNGEKITIDDLAVMINNGFNNQMDYMKKEFAKLVTKEEFNKRLDPLEKDVKYIKENLKSASELEKEVDYIKNTLSIPELKK